MSKTNTCENCKFWMNKQAELGYGSYDGICVSPQLKWRSDNEASAQVLDRANLHPTAENKSHRFENTSEVVPIGKVDKSRYCLITQSEFGCINFKKK